MLFQRSRCGSDAPVVLCSTPIHRLRSDGRVNESARVLSEASDEQCEETSEASPSPNPRGAHLAEIREDGVDVGQGAQDAVQVDVLVLQLRGDRRGVLPRGFHGQLQDGRQRRIALLRVLVLRKLLYSKCLFGPAGSEC